MHLLKFLLAILLIPCVLSAQQTTDPYENIRYIELENGLKAYILPDDQAVNTHIVAEVGVGMDVEHPDQAGISHLVEHIVFRDQRIPHKDYLDYIKDEGAFDINGYTQRYKTQYKATIDSTKAYWIVETFAQMLFDKEVTDEDLWVEKKALQTEIGELQWYHPPLYALQSVFKSVRELFPKQPDIFRDAFGLDDVQDLPSPYFYKRNNGTFTLKDVMDHYDAYYYPKNVTIKIVGNFNADKMQKLLVKAFGKYTKSGTKSVKEPASATEPYNKAYQMYNTGVNNRSFAYVGTQYVHDNYLRHIVIKSYSEHLSRKMQQLLRNKLGQTYSVNAFHNCRRKAALTGIVFSALHDDFDSNLQLVKDQIRHDISAIDEEDIEQALEQYSLKYSSVEHDVGSLMKLVDKQENLRDNYGIHDQTAFDIFNSITPAVFRKELQQSFVPERGYLQIYRDYSFFPWDRLLMTFVMFVSIIYVFVKAYTYGLFHNGPMYTLRNVVFSRRLAGRFFSVLYFALVFLLTEWFSGWSEFYMLKVLFDDPFYAYTISQPYNYFYDVISYTWFMMLFMLVGAWVFRRSYTRIDVTEGYLHLVGFVRRSIGKKEIAKIEKMNWSWDKLFKTYGLSFFFFKPLVKVTTYDNRTFYLRAKVAAELEEDLAKWKDAVG